jgi:TusA-related sulfurtransferase
MTRIRAGESLDLANVACPQNSARALLKLEGMCSGSILEIVIDDGEAVINVSAAIKEEGHNIIHKERRADKWMLLIKKE